MNNLTQFVLDEYEDLSNEDKLKFIESILPDIHRFYESGNLSIGIDKVNDTTLYIDVYHNEEDKWS